MNIKLPYSQVENCKELFHLARKVNNPTRTQRARVDQLITQLAMSVASTVEAQLYVRERANEQRREAEAVQGQEEGTAAGEARTMGEA